MVHVVFIMYSNLMCALYVDKPGRSNSGYEWLIIIEQAAWNKQDQQAAWNRPNSGDGQRADIRLSELA